MPALSLPLIQSLPDVLSADRFNMNFGSVPGFGDTFGTLTLKCMDVNIPGAQTQRFEVQLGNVDRSFRGKRQYSRQLTCTFAETVDVSTLAALRQWLENVVGTSSGNSQGYIGDYSVTAVLSVYDTTGAPVDVCTVYRCFPVEINDHNMSTAQSQPVTIQAVFSYDFVEWANTTVL